MEDKLDKLDSSYNNIIKEATHITETIHRINENYKDTITKNDMVEFKQVILKALDELEGNKYIPISTIRISCIDRAGSISDFRKLISSTLELEFEEGNFKEWALYKGNVFISYYEDSIEIINMVNREDDALLIEAKDKVLNKLIKEFNASKICLNTKLDDGYQNWEFFECEYYVKPIESWFTKFMRILGG